MSHEMPDKFDVHHRQQLSALIDGELPLEEARFLLRRLEHDEDLSGCQERWQLLGDVLRGRACAPAPQGFAERIQTAVAAEPAPVAAAMPAPRRRRGALLRWGGGGALAASVAAIALFISRQELPGQAPLEQPTTIIASQAQLPPAPPRAPLDTRGVADAAVAVAAVPAAAVTARRASATRTQQVSTRRVASRSEPVRALASQPALAPVVPAAAARTLPFGEVGALQARPWPRSTVGSSGALNTSFSPQEPQAAFYPFEPRLQEEVSGTPPARRGRD